MVWVFDVKNFLELVVICIGLFKELSVIVVFMFIFVNNFLDVIVLLFGVVIVMFCDVEINEIIKVILVILLLLFLIW